jgi:asparagine synthase (glutamine-hydrolysing)
MCLIAGGVGKNLRDKFRVMIEAGKHRGPDGFGVWTDKGVLKSNDFRKVVEIPNGKIGVLQCRLGMTGSKNYTQPFFNDLVLVHNGEIYNHRQLRGYLEGRGIDFDSDVDSEVILRLIEHLLENGLTMEESIRKAMEMLNGDYAVGLVRGGEIYLFRDPIGIRPLYYSPNGFFASEKKVLWAIGEGEAIPVKPGEMVVISMRGIKRKRLMNPTEPPGRMKLDEERGIKVLMRSLDCSIRMRVGEKTGILFSGGLDSSITALLASKYSDVVLYTAGVEGSQDLEWARKVSEMLGLELRERVFTKEDVEETLPKVMFAIEEPNPMNLAIGIPLYFATEAASKDGVKVLLSGQGADELFGGYVKYLKEPALMIKDIMELGDRNLARDDKIAMLNGVEGRYPFLALPVVWAAMSIPTELKIRNGVRKYILRRTAEELGLPAEVAWREKKAAQYGSGAQKLLERIAKERGMTLRGLAEETFRRVFNGPQ